MTAEAGPINDLPFFLQFRIAGNIDKAQKILTDEIDISFSQRGSACIATVYEEGDDGFTAALDTMSSLSKAGLHVIRLEVDWVVRVELAERAGVSRQVVSQWTAEGGGYDFPESSDLFTDGIWFWPDVEHWLMARGKIEAPEGQHLTLSQCNQINASLGQEVDPILRTMRRSGRLRGEFSIASLSRSLTLQQGAWVLGIALPALVNLLNSGRIPSQGQHVHRRVNLIDVLSYREARKARRHRAIASMGDYGTVDDSLIVSARMRKARQLVSQRRRSQTESSSAAEDR